VIKSYLSDRVIVKVGDITHEQTDAIVNAANWTLMGGGGVDGAIHDRGGEDILDACRQIRENEYPHGLPTGEVVVTTAGNLSATYVIHAVGPIYGMNEGRDAELLASCYRNSLTCATELELKSISFPSISTGAFYYPKHEAAKASSKAIQEFLKDQLVPEHVFLVFFDRSDAEIFIKHQSFKS